MRRFLFTALILLLAATFVNAQETYFTKHNRYSNDFKELKFDPSTPQVKLAITAADANCFEAGGSRPELDTNIYIDCHGLREP